MVRAADDEGRTWRFHKDSAVDVVRYATRLICLNIRPWRLCLRYSAARDINRTDMDV